MAIGQDAIRVDARDKVSGRAKYPGDFQMAGMLQMKILFSEKVHARVLAVDTSEAERYPGVIAVFTAKDVPVNEYGMLVADQPVLCGPGSSNPDGDIVRTVMDQIALVVAETEEAADAARKLIKVDFQELPAVFDPLEAIKDGSPQLHRANPNNICKHNRVRTGDVETAFAEADVIVESEYRTSWQEHAYLQPEAGLAYMDNDVVTIYVGGQWTHDDHEKICHSLQLPEEKVRVIYPAIGGAFGGREDVSIQIVLCLAALKLNRPVKIIWSRSESIKGHHKRHPYLIRSKWGAKNDGTIIAAETVIFEDAGAYTYTSAKVLGNATLMCVGPYDIPNVKIDSYAVFTNNIAGGAFRGFGGPQGALAGEAQINKLAEKLSMDPVELRMKNIMQEGENYFVGTPLPRGVTIGRVIEEAAEAGGWQRTDKGWSKPVIATELSPAKRRGLGFAATFKNIGYSFGAPEQCTAIIELHGGSEIERVVLKHGAAEVGQGTHTALAQMTADALGVPLTVVEPVMSDTATSGPAGSVSASRMTFMAGNSIIGAAELALQKWREEERPAIAKYTYRPPATTMFDPDDGHCNPNITYGYVAEVVDLEVDIETGQITIKNVICADDVGKAINPQQVIGQIEGCIVQAQGYAVMEDFQMRDGHVLTDRLSTYLIPTVVDVPERIESIVIESNDELGPFGARGMAEMPYLPFAPAVLDALYQATGIYFDQIPLTPHKLVKVFREHGLGN